MRWVAWIEISVPVLYEKVKYLSNQVVDYIAEETIDCYEFETLLNHWDYHLERRADIILKFNFIYLFVKLSFIVYLVHEIKILNKE